MTSKWNRIGAMLLIVSVALSILVFGPQSVNTQEPAVLRTVAYPTVGPVGTTFVVNVNIENVENLEGIQFKLTWNPSILQAVNISEVLFHSITPEVHWNNIWDLSLGINNTDGHADYAQTWKDPNLAVTDGYAPFNGSNTVATLIFNSISQGTTDLNLSSVAVVDLYANPIPCTLVTDNITVTAPSQAPPQFRVVPAEVTVPHVWNLLTVNVTFENLSPTQHILACQFSVHWNTTILQCLSIQEVAFHAVAPPGEESNIWQLQLRYNNTAGTAEYAFTWQDGNRAIGGGYAFMSGNGTWATLTFNCTALGETFLDLPVADLFDYNALTVFSEVHSGHVTVNQTTTTWILNLSHKLGNYIVLVQSDCAGVAGEGFNNDSNCIYFVPSSSWNSFYNITLPKTLLSGALKVVVNGTILPSTVDWNATHYFIYFHAESANLIEIFGERSVSISGDVNGDGKVGILDAIILSMHFGQTN